MYTLLVVVHVLVAVAVVGPAVLSPWLGERAIRRRDGDAVHSAGRTVMAFNALTLVAALFGALAVLSGDEHSFADAWLIIAATLYVIAVVIGVALIPATLARTGKELQDTDGGFDTEQLEQHRGRLLALMGLNAVFYGAITVLMVWRP
jgi:uncharacterized membrane protein